jgi:hypothetical protein
LIKRRKQIDPEPFAIAASVGSIVGGLAGAVALYRDFNRTRFRKSHRRALNILKNVQEVLAGMEKDLADMESLTEHALSIDVQPIWLGSRVLMVPAQFTEYAKRAEGLLPKLRKVLKATHRLERLAVSLPYVPSQSNRALVDLNLKIETILAGRHRPPTAMLAEVGQIVKQSRSVVKELFAELGGQESDNQ